MKTGLRRLASLLAILLASLPAIAEGPSLLRVQRRTQDDRTILLKGGIPIVYEFSEGFLAAGEPAGIVKGLRSLGYEGTLVDGDADGWTYFAVGPRDGAAIGSASPCGQVVWSEEGWDLLRSPQGAREGCPDEGIAWLREISLRPLGLPLPPPREYAALQGGGRSDLETKPLVSQIVAGIPSGAAAANWDAVIGFAPSRNTENPGCVTAAGDVYARYQSSGMEAAYQVWSSSVAPNVVGTLEGKTEPEKVIIAVAHLDDMPAHGAAPGADDNASGVAMLLTAAQALSGCAFSQTVKLLAVTGEEQGLLGSRFYADDARARGEQIQAVLNADMIGWQGDTPGTEDLDLNYIPNSRWLGQLFAQCAAGYGTGCAVNDFECQIEASDHASFWDLGYSAVCGITDNEGYCGHQGHYPYYHTPNDTREHCGDPAFFESAVRAYVATLAHLADPLCRSGEAPSGLTAEAAGENQIRLAWAPPAGGKSYEVYRSRSGCASASFSKIGEAGSPEFLDQSACGDFRFTYRVAARDATGFCLSPPSACAQARAAGHCLDAPGDERPIGASGAGSVE